MRAIRELVGNAQIVVPCVRIKNTPAIFSRSYEQLERRVSKKKVALSEDEGFFGVLEGEA